MIIFILKCFNLNLNHSKVLASSVSRERIEENTTAPLNFTNNEDLSVCLFITQSCWNLEYRSYWLQYFIFDPDSPDPHSLS